jgi:hypothetical protein
MRTQDKIRSTQHMTLKHFAVWSALVPVAIGAVEARAQSIVTPKLDVQASQANSNLPDACKLLSQADIEGLFPRRPIASKGPTLSPIYKGPQYTERCMYMVKLPSPASKLEVASLVSINIINWGGDTDGRYGSAATFASIRSSLENIDPALNIRFVLQGSKVRLDRQLGGAPVCMNESRTRLLNFKRSTAPRCGHSLFYSGNGPRSPALFGNRLDPAGFDPGAARGATG